MIFYEGGISILESEIFFEVFSIQRQRWPALEFYTFSVTVVSYC